MRHIKSGHVCRDFPGFIHLIDYLIDFDCAVLNTYYTLHLKCDTMMRRLNTFRIISPSISCRNSFVFAVFPLNSFNDAIKTREFWILFTFQSVVILSVMVLNNLGKAFGQNYIVDDQFFAAVGVVQCVFSTLSRVAWGVVLDERGFKVSRKVCTA